MFDALGSSLRASLRRLTGSGRISAADLEAGLADIRTSLVGADVAMPVVAQLLERIGEAADGPSTIWLRERLTDADPAIASAAAQYLTTLTGSAVVDRTRLTRRAEPVVEMSINARSRRPTALFSNETPLPVPETEA